MAKIIGWYIHSLASSRRRLNSIGSCERQPYHLYSSRKRQEIRQQITLDNNFLLFDCYLDFYNWFRVFLHCWIRKWHMFFSIRSGFVLDWFEKKKSDFVTKSITFLWHNQLIFVNTYSKYVFKRKNVLPTTYIDYLIEMSITVNWMVGINKGKYS